MQSRVQTQSHAPAAHKSPNKKFIFASILAAGLSIASAKSPPLPENPYPRHIPNVLVQSKKDFLQYLESRKVSKPKELSRLNPSQYLKELSWVYKGTEVEALLRKYPPVVFALDQKSIIALKGASNTYAGYIPGTNIIVFSTEFTVSDNKLQYNYLHELSHYISWLGYSRVLGYFNGNKYRVQRDPDWIEEGLASLIACRSMGKKCAFESFGNGDDMLAYAMETYVGVMMEFIAGREAVARAQLTGDFEQIRAAMDNYFGKGTFSEFIGKENAVDAAAVLFGKNPRFMKELWNTEEHGDSLSTELMQKSEVLWKLIQEEGMYLLLRDVALMLSYRK